MGSFGTGDSQFNEVYGVAVDSINNVYVSDRGNHRIQKFTSGGIFITKWGSLGSGDGQLNNPFGVFVGSSDYVYVTDTFNHRIQKFTSAGIFITKWGSFGTGEGQFFIRLGSLLTPQTARMLQIHLIIAFKSLLTREILF